MAKISSSAWDDQLVVDTDLAEFIFDDGDFAAVLFSEHAVQQGGLAGAEKAGEHGDGDAVVGRHKEKKLEWQTADGGWGMADGGWGMGDGGGQKSAVSGQWQMSGEDVRLWRRMKDGNESRTTQKRQLD